MSRANKKRQHATQATNAPQCIIASKDRLARKCEQALKEALGLDHVDCRTLEYRGTTSLYFFSPPLVEAEVRGRNRPVLPLPGGKRWLHIAVDLHFIAEQCWRVNHVSIGLLQGDPSAPQKVPVLRAEWQIHEAVDDSGHAQPHWHVLSAAGVADLPKFNEVVEAAPRFEAFLAPPQPASNVGEAFGHFHYAMVTDWHRLPSTGPYQVLQDEASLVSWVDGCVRYIRHQLGYVDRKSD